MKLNSKLSRMIIFILHIFGLWPKSKTSQKIYKLYSYVIHFIFSLLYVMCMVFNFSTIDSIINATDALFPTLTVVAYCFKVINFYLNITGMTNMFKTVTNFQFQNDDEIQSTNDKLGFLYKLSVCFMTTAHVTIILAFVRVLFIENRVELPLPCWYPIDWKNIPLFYWIAYAYQMTGAFFVLNVNISLDLYSIYLMAMISKYLEILSDRLEHINLECDSNTCEVMATDSLDQIRVNEELINCVKVHQHLARIVADFERNFSLGLFFQISLSGVMICSAVYQLSTLSPFAEFFRYIYCLTFFITLVLQIFMISYFGDKILTASNLLTSSAYSSSWYTASSKFRKHLLILMMRLNRESEIVAGKIFPINLMLFTTVMNFSYRLYALLKG